MPIISQLRLFIARFQLGRAQQRYDSALQRLTDAKAEFQYARDWEIKLSVDLKVAQEQVARAKFEILRGERKKFLGV